MRSNNGTPAHRTTLTLAELNRSPGATLFVESLIGAPLGGPGAVDPRIFISSPPTLTNDLLGAWATTFVGFTNEIDFATYDANQGIHSLPAAGRPAQVNGASASDNVRATAVLSPLTQDTTINSLEYPVSSPALVLNLGGHTLNIASGGIIRNAMQENFIANGRLTAGGSSPGGELIVFNGDDRIVINASIVDNPGGAVSLVKSGNGQLRLSGNNTYSGRTVINDGNISVGSATAIPFQSDVDINGGQFWSGFDSATPIDLGDVTLRNM